MEIKAIPNEVTLNYSKRISKYNKTFLPKCRYIKNISYFMHLLRRLLKPKDKEVLNLFLNKILRNTPLSFPSAKKFFY